MPQGPDQVTIQNVHMPQAHGHRQAETYTEMCNRVAERMDRFQNWIGRVWYTDEVHFHLNGPVNHHNNVYWGDERPEEVDERCLKRPKVTAICALNAKKEILGPYWF